MVRQRITQDPVATIYFLCARRGALTFDIVANAFSVSVKLAAMDVASSSTDKMGTSLIEWYHSVCARLSL
jgi:hypothetical protein